MREPYRGKITGKLPALANVLSCTADETEMMSFMRTTKSTTKNCFRNRFFYGLVREPTGGWTRNT
jgi:hypothetical protein